MQGFFQRHEVIVCLFRFSKHLHFRLDDYQQCALAKSEDLILNTLVHSMYSIAILFQCSTGSLILTLEIHAILPFDRFVQVA